MPAFVLVAAPHPDGQRHLAAGTRREPVLDRDEVAGDQREEIGGLGVWIDPFRPMPPVVGLARAGRVAVRQQHRKPRLVGGDRRRVAGHHIRPVEEIGDPAEAFGLALGAEIAARHVEAGELGVALGRNAGLDLEGECVGRLLDDQPALLRQSIAVGAERLAVEPQCNQLQRLAVEMQRRVRRRCGRVAADRQARPDPGVPGAELEGEIDRVDQKIRRPVIGEPDRLGRRRIG